jgi:hypothetical protein
VLQERSSPKRKEIFKGIQLRIRRTGEAGVASVGVIVGKQLILDMKVRWSSTYHMLLRALELREVRLIPPSSLSVSAKMLWFDKCVDDFVVEISYDGASAEERAKIRALS